MSVPNVSLGLGTVTRILKLRGVPLPLERAGNHRIKCRHSRSMQRVLELISWSKNPRKSLIIKDLSPAWLSGRALASHARGQWFESISGHKHFHADRKS